MVAAYKKVLSKAFQGFGEDQVPRLSAALTFYAMLALAPLLLLAVAVAGFFLGEESVRDRIATEIEASMGGAQAEFVASLMETQNTTTGIIAVVFSFGVLIFSASGLFEQLRMSINAIWGVTAPEGGLMSIVKRRLIAIVAVLVGAALMLGWLATDAWLHWVSENTFSSTAPLWKMVSFAAAWAFLTIVFAFAYRFFPRKAVQWNDVWLPAAVTAFAFAIGKYLLSLYFAFASVSAGYGAAGALVVLLLWIYYSSQIFFFGAEISCVYAYELGSLKDEEPEAEKKVSPQGTVEDADGESKWGPDDAQASDVPAPSLTNSISGLGQSLGHLGQSFADLGKSFAGQKRDEDQAA